jgi:pimeloyl-ACP methyl ester carboxylesterase
MRTPEKVNNSTEYKSVCVRRVVASSTLISQVFCFGIDMRAALILSLLVLGFIASTGCVASPTSKTVEVKTTAFQGKVYVPSASPRRSVGIVLIGGSEGQLLLADAVAPQLAATGYRVLGINYHGGWADRSRPLSNVPLEQFTAAVDWMQKQPNVRRVVVIGESRGSEAALLTALRSLHVSGVIGMVPSIYVWSAVGSAEPDGPSGWSEGGKPLIYVRPIKEAQPDAGTFTRAIAAMRESNAAHELEQATIPIELIRAPMLLIGGDDDAGGLQAILFARRKRASSGLSPQSNWMRVIIPTLGIDCSASGRDHPRNRMNGQAVCSYRATVGPKRATLAHGRARGKQLRRFWNALKDKSSVVWTASAHPSFEYEIILLRRIGGHRVPTLQSYNANFIMQNSSRISSCLTAPNRS